MTGGTKLLAWTRPRMGKGNLLPVSVGLRPALVFGLIISAGCGSSNSASAPPIPTAESAPTTQLPDDDTRGGEPEASRKKAPPRDAAKKAARSRRVSQGAPGSPASATMRESDEPESVQTAKAARPAARSRDQGALLTKENYEKIRTGMTRDEVISVLGPSNSSAGSGKDWKLTWRPRGVKNQEIEVHFRAGKVAAKRSTMAWQPEEKPPETAPAAEVVQDDKLQKAIDRLRSREKKKICAALEFLKEAPLDEERAPEISKLIERCVDSNDWAVSSTAEPAMRRWATKENVPYFLRVLSRPVDPRDATDKNREHQPLAMEILVKLREPQAVAPIAKILTRFFDRDEAKRALLELGPELAEREVLKYANHRDFNVALAAREILEEFKTGSGKRLDQCLADLHSPVADKRLWAAQAIGSMPVDPARRREVAVALEKLLSDKYGWPAHAAAAALANWCVPENEPALVVALGHASPDMRRLAAEALAKVGTKMAIPALEKIAAAEKLHPETARAAADAISAIRERN